MKNKFLYKLRSGKNPKFIYYAINACRLLMPKFFFRMRLHNRLETLSRRNDRTYIEQRVNYYNKLTGPIKLPSTAPHLAEHKIGKQKVYFFDTYQYTRWFPVRFQWGFYPGAAGGTDGTEFSAGAFFSPVENGREMRKMALFYCLFGRNDYFCKIGLG